MQFDAAWDEWLLNAAPLLPMVSNAPQTYSPAVPYSRSRSYDKMGKVSVTCGVVVLDA